MAERLLRAGQLASARDVCAAVPPSVADANAGLIVRRNCGSPACPCRGERKRERRTSVDERGRANGKNERKTDEKKRKKRKEKRKREKKNKKCHAYSLGVMRRPHESCPN